jgi:hypothetical protein
MSSSVSTLVCQRDARPAKAIAVRSSFKRTRRDPSGDHQHERHGHHLLVSAQRPIERRAARAAAGASGVPRARQEQPVQHQRQKEDGRERRNRCGEKPRAEADLQAELARDLDADRFTDVAVIQSAEETERLAMPQNMR